MSEKATNILPQPIDFKFPFKKVFQGVDYNLECTATCRRYDGESKCGVIIWHIYDVDAKTKLDGDSYHATKDLVMKQYDENSKFKRVIISHLQLEINKRITPTDIPLWQQ